MAKGKRGNFADYDDDELDDDYDDYDDYDEYQPEAPAAPAPPTGRGKATASAPAPQPGAAKPQAAAAAGGSTSAAARPAAAAVAKEPLASQKLQASFPLVPEPAGADGLQPFAFNTPSPDDAVLEAQKGRAGGPQHKSSFLTPTPVAPRAPKSHPPPGPTPSVPSTGRGGPASSSTSNSALGSAADSPDACGDPGGGVSGRLSGLSLDPSGASKHPPRRPLSEFRQDPQLARELAALECGGSSKPPLHLVVLGHVDAGKSTLMGRLLHELGRVSSKEVHKNQKEAAAMGKGSFAWAWLLDERPEERSRGVTVDVAMTHFETPRLWVTLLDAPGHRDFVPNMISGAAQADAALLLLDGAPGGFEAGFAGEGASLGQTREHAQLARSLGVEQLAVVVSKLDTVSYSQERFEAIRAAIQPFLKTCGFRESAVQVLPAVGPTGDNLRGGADPEGLGRWWSGRSVLEAIDGFAPGRRNTGLPVRLPIADVFRGRQGGTAVGGKLEAGALKPGQKVMVVPSWEVGTVKSIESQGQAQPLARAGDNVDVVLAGIDPQHLTTGAMICDPDFPVPLTSRFEARIVVLDVSVPVLLGQSVSLHVHTARREGHLSALLSVLNSKTGEVTKTRPRCLTKGQTAVVEVTLARDVCLEEYAELRALGRVALRDGGQTIGVGIVTRLVS